MDCNNYREITLLSVPGKIIARLLLNRIHHHLILTQRPEQAGFMPKKSTINQIHVLLVLIKCRLKNQSGLLAAYVDFKKNRSLLGPLGRHVIPTGSLSLK